MPISSFSYDAIIDGSDLSGLPLGSALGSSVKLIIHRDVSLAWDVVDGSTSKFLGREGNVCWEVETTEHTVIWKAQVTETVTKTTRPLPLINEIGDTIDTIGKTITSIGTAAAFWVGVSALTPAAPTAPITGTAAGVITAGGGLIIGAGKLLKWLTDPRSTSWTTTYQETGEDTFISATFLRIECQSGQEYRRIKVPQNPPTYDFLLSELVSKIGTEVANSGNLHPPQEQNR